MKKIIILALIYFQSFVLSASPYNDIIAQANKAYTDGKYNNAIELYKQVVNNGYQSAQLYYNLGNAYFKNKNYPRAMLYLEKAKKLDPANPKIDFNIQVCNTKIIDKIEELPQPFYRNWINSFCLWFSMDVWARFSVVFLFLFVSFVAIYLMANPVRIRKASFWASLLFLAIALTSGINAHSQYRGINQSRQAIIFEPTVNVKSSPDPNSQDIFVIHEGTKVAITDKVGTWIQIQIANGSDGWIAETVVERI
ncbi:MAG: tetratricopeptide repeat protein [Bacteroidota bacterium]